jgi:hypothetical protein
MQQNPKTGRTMVSFEEMAVSTMLLQEALIQLLDEKGLISKAEVMERLKQLQAETGARFLGQKQ